MRLARVAITCWLMMVPAIAMAFETTARSAMVVDVSTGTVLLAKDADRPVPPASMSKLMTLYMLFEAVEQGRATLGTKFLVSKKAHGMGGSTMFLRLNERVSVENLIRGIIVQSGNDACVVVAEGLAGTEAEFARRMTNKGREIGLTNSTFANSTGWPHPGQRMSARDLVFLADKLIKEFPGFYPYFSEQKFTWDNITQDNRNPLLGLGIGADGLKTGHTEEAGYGLVGSAKQGDRRIIFMITGLDSKSARASESERLANWAFRQFVKKDLFTKGTRVASAPVWIGKQSEVGLYTKDGISTLVPFDSKGPLDIKVRYEGPIEAPIKKGDKIAIMTISPQGMEPTEYPLFSDTDIAKGGIISRMRASAERLSQDYLGSSLLGAE